jgi:hypothetical protein
MLLGLIVRSGTFTINAGLVFLLAQHVPQLDWRQAVAKPGVFEEYRNSILAGLGRVRADLKANGKLHFPVPQMGDAPTPKRSVATGRI